MYRTLMPAVTLIVLSTGCASTKMHSFTDPDFRGKAYGRVPITPQFDDRDVLHRGIGGHEGRGIAVDGGRYAKTTDLGADRPTPGLRQYRSQPGGQRGLAAGMPTWARGTLQHTGRETCAAAIPCARERRLLALVSGTWTLKEVARCTSLPARVDDPPLTVLELKVQFCPVDIGSYLAEICAGLDRSAGSRERDLHMCEVLSFESDLVDPRKYAHSLIDDEISAKSPTEAILVQPTLTGEIR